MTKPPSSRRNGPEGREVSAEEAARLRELRNIQYETKIEAAKSKRERRKASTEGSRGPAGDNSRETESELPAGVEGDAGVKANPEPEARRKSDAKRAPGAHSEKHPKPGKKRAEDAGEHEQSQGQGRVSVVDRLLATEEDRPYGWARSLRLEESLFYADREVFDRARTSLPWYRKQLGTIIDWLEAHGVASSEGVLETDMQAFLTEVASRESNGPGDLRDLDIAARIFFNVMVSEDIIAASPMTNIPRAKAAGGRLSVAGPEVLRRATAAANATPQGAHDTALVLCFADLAWTPDKFVQLTVGDVDFVTGAVLSRGPS